MADFYELEKRYEKVPQEMRQQKRWICYAVSTRGQKQSKIPINALGVNDSFQGAIASDASTWCDFNKALAFCAENALEGIGFELLDSGMFAIDLDNKPDENGKQLPQKDFQDMVNDFVATLDSYTEWSASGNGVHIICYGKLPEGTKSDNVAIEIYEGAKYFVITGNAIRRSFIKDGSEKIGVLLKKYARKTEERPTSNGYEDVSETLTDSQVLKNMASSKSGPKISRLFKGDCSDYGGERKKAIQALCNFIAYFSSCDAEQVERIFEKSALVGEEWESHKAEFIGNAIDECAAFNIKPKAKKEPSQGTSSNGTVMNIDENGEPIFRISESIKSRRDYSLDDTGNAQRFYDYFGAHFKWNATDKKYMFWTGKTWIYDTKGIIRKYANHLILMLEEEARQLREQIKDEGSDERRRILLGKLDAYEKNIKRISNKAGKDAMLNELQFLGQCAAETSEFNKDPYLINTDSGIVDLRTGEIMPFERERMLSLNTKVKVSYETPETWLAFLRDIFQCENEQEVQEKIDTLQRCLGYTLTGLTKEQVIFMLQGEGSNGKSTMMNVVKAVMGDYFGTIASNQLMVSKNQNSSVAIQNSFAELIGTRFLLTQETDEGVRISESTIKELSGDEDISAQKKYGNPFFFRPSFKLWMATNNLPIIRGKDYGIWRRIFLFTFKRQFKDSEKDKNMPEKLAAEYDRILGWCIQGAVKYLANLDLAMPECMKIDLSNYQQELDTVLQFINAECFKVNGRAILKRTIYDCYSKWALRSNLPALSEPKFRNEMIKKGYGLVVHPRTHAQYYKDIVISDNGMDSSDTFDYNADDEMDF